MVLRMFVAFVLSVWCTAFGVIQPSCSRFSIPPVRQLPKSQMPAAHAWRTLSWEGVDNARDLGGLVTQDGRTVRRGLVYRSQAFNNNAISSWVTAERMERQLQEGKFPHLYGRARADEVLARIGTNDLSRSCAVIAAELTAGTNAWKKGESRGTAESRARILRETGLRTEIDLRTREETWGMQKSPLGPKVRWLNIPSEMIEDLRKPEGEKAFAQCFRIFLDRENYPIDFHCIAGADRTGALALVLYGILGVSEADIYADYSLTSYSNSGMRPVEKFKEKVDVTFASIPGKTLNEKTVSYVLECGFTEADIARFREIMLDPAGSGNVCGGEVTMQNIAHRGMWDKDVPQNTVESIKRAYDAGATWVETDFHHTKAGQMVCIHQESELRKYTGCKKKIIDLTPDDIATLNLGEKDALPKVYRIPLLDQVLAVVPKHGVLQAEIKGYSPQYADIFDAAVRKAGLTETNIVVSSFRYDALKDFKARYPKYRAVWLVVLPRKKPFDAKKYIAKCKAAGVEVFCPGCHTTRGVMTPADADAMRMAGLELRFWGVNSPDDLRQAKMFGAVGFTCNHWREAFDWAAEVGGVKLLK